MLAKRRHGTPKFQLYTSAGAGSNALRTRGHRARFLSIRSESIDIDRHGGPDERKRHELGRRERLVEEKHGQQKLRSSAPGIARMPSVENRNRRAAAANNSSGTQVTTPLAISLQAHRRVARAKRAFAPCFQITDVRPAQRREQQRLDEQAQQSVDGHLLAQQSVKGERHGQRHGDPRHAQNRHAARRPARCCPSASAANARPGSATPSSHVDQRIEKIAQAGFDHLVGRYRIDVDEPVERQQQRAGRQGQHDRPRRAVPGHVAASGPQA